MPPSWQQRDDKEEQDNRPPPPPKTCNEQPAAAPSVQAVRVMRLKNTFPEGQVAPMQMPLAFKTHANDAAITIQPTEPLQVACKRLAGSEASCYPSGKMEVTVYNKYGTMRTHYRDVSSTARLQVFEALSDDRIVIWDK